MKSFEVIVHAHNLIWSYFSVLVYFLLYFSIWLVYWRAFVKSLSRVEKGNLIIKGFLLNHIQQWRLSIHQIVNVNFHHSIVQTNRFSLIQLDILEVSLVSRLSSVLTERNELSSPQDRRRLLGCLFAYLLNIQVVDEGILVHWTNVVSGEIYRYWWWWFWNRQLDCFLFDVPPLVLMPVCDK